MPSQWFLSSPLRLWSWLMTTSNTFTIEPIMCLLTILRSDTRESIIHLCIKIPRGSKCDKRLFVVSGDIESWRCEPIGLHVSTRQPLGGEIRRRRAVRSSGLAAWAAATSAHHHYLWHHNHHNNFEQHHHNNGVLRIWLPELLPRPHISMCGISSVTRQDICPCFYTTGISGQKSYVVKVRSLWNS